MKKFLISFFSILLVILLPIGGFFIYGECIAKDVYTDTYYAELNDKVERLRTRENNKIVFIGGSSLIFGLRSEEIEKATGYDVVDFGLYASLGTPIMMKLAEPYIKSGDVVVLAPEINEQTYSSYIGYETALKCFENMNYPVASFTPEENMKFFFHYFRFLIDKGNANIELEAPYDRASFNEYTDIDNEIVKNNILMDYYDATQMVVPSKELVNNDFVDVVNNYYNKLNKRGAKLYFSFSPTNQLALNKEGLNEFNEELANKLKCPILGSINDFTYHQYYFYDTNFHLNRAGTYLHSKTMSDLLKEALEIENTYEINVPEAPEPEYKKSDVVNIIDGAKYREIRSKEGKLTYSFQGLVDESKNVEEYHVPEQVNGITVTNIGYHVFKDMPYLKKVTLSKTITSLVNPLFENCPNAEALYLEHEKAPSVCATGLVDGASPNIKIYIKAEYYLKFINNYSWMAYSGLFEAY